MGLTPRRESTPRDDRKTSKIWLFQIKIRHSLLSFLRELPKVKD
jgi:hypothetical protein